MQEADAISRGAAARGLYRRALEIKEYGGASSAIDADERAEILNEIEALGARTPPGEDELEFSSRRQGTLLPFATNVAAVAVTAAGLLALLWVFRVEERGIVASARTLLGAEGELVAVLREDTAVRLAEKDHEVEASLRRLRELAAERDRLKLAASAGDAAARAQAAVRIAELERRIADASAALERARAERRVAEIAAAPPPAAAAPAAAPAAGAPQPLADATRQADSERLALERLAAGYRGFGQEAAARSWEAAGSRLDEVEALLADEAVARLPVIQRVRGVETATIALLRGLLARLREGTAAAPAASRSDETLARVNALVRQAEARLRANQAAAAETLYLSALSEIPDVRTAYERAIGLERRRWQDERFTLERRLADLQAELTRRATELQNEANRRVAELQEEISRRQQALARLGEEAAREREARRQEQAARSDKITSLTRGLREQAPPAVEPPRGSSGKVLDLLKTKALLKQVADSAPVRAQYPDLYDAMDEYFDRFGAEKIRAGEQAALARVVSVVERLLGERPTDTAPMSLEETFKVLVDRLSALLRAI